MHCGITGCYKLLFTLKDSFRLDDGMIISVCPEHAVVLRKAVKENKRRASH